MAKPIELNRRPNQETSFPKRRRSLLRKPKGNIEPLMTTDIPASGLKNTFPTPKHKESNTSYCSTMDQTRVSLQEAEECVENQKWVVC
jgi:hypothetical protein